jgi:hypothetical protein
MEKAFAVARKAPSATRQTEDKIDSRQGDQLYRVNATMDTPIAAFCAFNATLDTFNVAMYGHYATNDAVNATFCAKVATLNGRRARHKLPLASSASPKKAVVPCNVA